MKLLGQTNSLSQAGCLVNCSMDAAISKNARSSSTFRSRHRLDCMAWKVRSKASRSLTNCSLLYQCPVIVAFLYGRMGMTDMTSSLGPKTSLTMIDLCVTIGYITKNDIVEVVCLRQSNEWYGVPAG